MFFKIKILIAPVGGGNKNAYKHIFLLPPIGGAINLKSVFFIAPRRGAIKYMRSSACGRVTNLGKKKDLPQAEERMYSLRIWGLAPPHLR